MFSWQSLVKIALFVAVIDGALRKWFFPGLATPLYFFKDAILIAAYFQFFRIYPSLAIPREYGFAGSMVMLSIITIMMFSFHPDQPSLELSIMALRHYLIYVPLLWLVPRMFRSQEELISFLQIYVLTAIPVGLLGFIQYFSPHDSYINRYVGDEELQVATFGEGSRARITGTFSYVGGYALYLSYVFTLGIGLYLNHYLTFMRRLLLSVAISVIVMNMFMTGSRGPVYNAAITVALVVFALSLLDSQGLRKHLRTIILISIVGAIGVAKSPALHDFIDRAQNSDTLEDRGLTLDAMANQFFNIMRYDNVLGEGAGSYHQASWAYMRVAGIPIPEKLKIEAELDRVLAELGPAGYSVWYFMRLTLIFAFISLLRRTRNVGLKMLVLSMLLLHVQNYYTTMVYHHTFGLYYWFSAGFLALVPRLEAAEYNRPLMAYYSTGHTMGVAPQVPDVALPASPSPAANPLAATPGRFDALEGKSAWRGDGSGEG